MRDGVVSEDDLLSSTRDQDRGSANASYRPPLHEEDHILFSDAILRFTRAFKEKMQYDALDVLECRDALHIVDMTQRGQGHLKS